MNFSLWPAVGKAVYLFARGWMDVLNALWWRTEIVGADQIPKSGAFLLCPVHRSNIDGPLVATLTRRPMRVLAKEELFKFSVPAKLFRSMGAISVNRDAPDRKSLNYCKQEMDAGWPLVLFPEGGRRDGPIVEPLQEGAAFLALRSDVPVVPVGIWGSEQINPRRTIFFRPYKLRIVVGEPMLLPKPEGSTRVPRSAIAGGTVLLQERLQQLMDQAEAGVGFHDKGIRRLLGRRSNSKAVS